MVRMGRSGAFASGALRQAIGAKNIVATIPTNNHLFTELTHTTSIQFTHTSFGHHGQQFMGIQDDACSQDINLQMSVDMLVVTLSSYAEVITEELDTTMFAYG